MTTLSIPAVSESRDAAQAAEFRGLIRHRDELAEWLVDQASDNRGRLVKDQVDASLGGEDFIPCTFTAHKDGREYRISLVSTVYSIEEV